MSFVHLHLHTEYSLLDGVCRLGQLLDTAKSLGQNAVAITDHGAMYGVIDFYKEAKKRDIKPIIGCEVYVAARTRFEKNSTLDRERNHLILLCENNTGYQNLIKIVSESWINGFYVKPRVDHDLLKENHEGLIALSACLMGEVPQALLRGDYEEARRVALWYNDTFGQGNYFLELQNHGLKEQLQLNPQLIKLSKETGIPLVATNDTHYINKEDSKTQQVLICIQTNHVVGENTGIEFETDEFYLKSEEEMRTLFPNVLEAVDNTAKIAERCHVEFEFGNTKLPFFEVPDGKDHYQYFREMCFAGLSERYGENPPEDYIKRLEYELDVINSMGYVDYFLIVYDFIRYAKSKKIPVGPGRGSGAGSIAAYCVGITGIDPMKYNLIFERFLNPERISMPDFDIDFCYERRSEVIDYVINRYGSDHVAQIITFGTMAARAAIRDVGRATGMSYATVDAVAKQIPRELNITIASALQKSSEFRDMVEKDEKVRELIDMASKVEGMPRHASTHAAGVVITRDPVSSYVPLALNDESAVTQYTMTALEELGLLKMDFLGLRTLTVIEDTQKMVRQKYPDFDIDKVDLEDADTFKMLSMGFTEGVFQFESAGMRNVLVGLKPVSVEDLIAVISLYRPGPMESIPKYIENRHHPQKVVYKTPLLKNILDVTYGCMVYQEQVMQIFRDLAGYSYGRADLVRRAMSKKKHSVMEQERKNFIYGMQNDDGSCECEGAVKRGVPEQAANALFDEMISFASYAFNKSHAAAYAFVAYQTAYLKCHHTSEFMAAILTSVLDSSGKVAEYIAECERLGIRVLPPNVNESFESFTVSDNSIRFGLLAIKNLGRNFISTIISERNNGGKYTSFYSFCKRVYGRELNKRALESLIKSGALDNLGANRRQMLIALPDILQNLENEKRNNIEGQIGFFDVGAGFDSAAEPELEAVPEMPMQELLRLEKEITGIYLSGHPMEEYKSLSQKLGSAKISDLHASNEEMGGIYSDNAHIKLLCIISSVKKKILKNNTTMAFMEVEDIYGSIEVIVFPRIYSENIQLLSEGNVVLIKGRLSLSEDDNAKIVCDTISPCSGEAQIEEMANGQESDKSEKKPVRKGLFLRLPSKECAEKIKAEKVLAIFDGGTPLYYYYMDSKKYELQDRNRFVSVNEPMLKALKNILGGENVVSQ